MNDPIMRGAAARRSGLFALALLIAIGLLGSYARAGLGDAPEAG